MLGIILLERRRPPSLVAGKEVFGHKCSVWFTAVMRNYMVVLAVGDCLWFGCYATAWLGTWRDTRLEVAPNHQNLPHCEYGGTKSTFGWMGLNLKCHSETPQPSRPSTANSQKRSMTRPSHCQPNITSTASTTRTWADQGHPFNMSHCISIRKYSTVTGWGMKQETLFGFTWI